MNEWEHVNTWTRRCRVPGGWIYETEHWHEGDIFAVNCVFVPEPTPQVYNVDLSKPPFVVT